MSYREELESGRKRGAEQPDMISHLIHGVPGGARQNVPSEISHDAVNRPGGAAQNSGGAIEGNAEEQGAA